MLRNRIFLKSFAIFFILEMVVSTVWPTVSYALTAGPTAPEATSFEPVDTTDMVNLATGDLAYNIPLLEVPGPSGGYPLSLSYHAGIMPEEEASWVGLGWTLNPGSLTRNVNGFADDHFNVTNTDRSFWAGGETHSLEIGLTMGISGVVGVSGGLSFSQDTYGGFSVGTMGGVGISIGSAISVGLHVDSRNGASGNISLGASTNSAISLSGQIGISTNFNTVGGYASGGLSVPYDRSSEPGKARINAGGASLIGATISSKNNSGGSISVAGSTSIYNSKQGKVSTYAYGITLPVPFINIGYNYQRYWIDETEKVEVNGSLYNPTDRVTNGFDKKAFDSYTLLDPSVGFVENPDPDKVLGGSFLSYDAYNVNAQGLGGSIKPYSFKSLVFRQSRKTSGGNYKIKQYNYPDGTYLNKPTEFRFINDFSNRYLNDGGNMPWIYWNNSSVPMLIPEFESAEKTGELGNQTDGIKNEHLAGSRHIEWYTNDQILNNDNSKNPDQEGFIDCRATGFTRVNIGSKGSQIGGFKITNESGVTYHFALPAYVYNEYQRSENIDDKTGKTFNELTKKEPYAYTWYLTAVTGPDYVDRSQTGPADGILNEYDWGYWVEFEYGKWTDFYAWRNPGQGMTQDLDDNFQNFSEGLKELYYLDAIRSKTHTALFAKSIRHDAKGSIYSLRNKSALNDESKVTVTSVTKEGGFIPASITNTCLTLYGLLNVEDQGDISYTARPTSSLKLDSIYLISNSDLATIPYTKGNGVPYSQSYTYTWDIDENHSNQDNEQCDFSSYVSNHHFYQNVFDVHDLAIFGNSLRNKSIRVIGFESSYELAPETENSFDFGLVKVASPSEESDDYPRFGKLTLEGIQFKGKASADLIPPMKFEYDLENPLRGIGYVYRQSGEELVTREYVLSLPNSELTEGDIIKMTSGDRTCYAVVYEIAGGTHKIRILGKQKPFDNQNVSWSTTKNPPYNKDNYDMWGFYKSDYKLLEGSENFDRIVSEISTKSNDVWSLRKVFSSSGSQIKIGYETDTYKTVLKKLSNLTIKNIEPYDFNSKTLKITFRNHKNLLELTNLSIGGQYSVYGMIRYWGYPFSLGYACDGAWEGDAYYWEGYNTNVTILNKSDNYLLVSNNALFDQMVNTSYGSQRYNSYYASFSNNTADPVFIFDTPPICLGGELLLPEQFNSIGGGLRVNEISLVQDSKMSSTLFEYQSGSTSYEPLHMELPLTKLGYNANSCMIDTEKREYDAFRNIHYERLYGKYSGLLAISRELPSPGIVYQNVKVHEKFTGEIIPNYIQYEFESFAENTLTVDTLFSNSITSTSYYDGITYKKIKRKDVIFNDFSSIIGQIRRQSLHSSSGTILSETTNHFLYDIVSGTTPIESINDYKSKLGTDFNSQGVINEVTMDGRLVKNEDGDFELLGIVSRRHQLPAIQTGQTIVDHKSGITTTTEHLAFDFYSGQVTKTLSKDGYGNTFISESTPAYRLYPTLSLTAQGGYNMLTQEASSYTYKIDPNSNNAKIGLVSGGIQTWSGEIDMLEHAELNQTIVLSSVGVKNAAGYYPAVSQGLTNFLIVGDRVRFTNAGQVYHAKIVSATKKQVQNQYEYDLQLITVPQEILSAISNVSCKRLTVPRKNASYVYIGDDNTALQSDGLFPITNNELPLFTAWNKGDATPPNWQKNGEITLYDVHSHALEASDVNSQYTATKMSSDQTQVLTTAANARYDEFVFSGTEDPVLPNGSFGGGVSKGAGSITTTKFHTGKSSLLLTPTQSGFTVALKTDSKRKYFNASVWVHETAASNAQLYYAFQPDGQSIPANTTINIDLASAKKAGQWYQFNVRVPVPVSPPTPVIKYTLHLGIKNNGAQPIYVDDFRVHPMDAAMTSYVYSPWGELSHILDNNNLFTEYRYDGMGRLKETYKESFLGPNAQARYGNSGIVKVSEVNYNYGNNNPYVATITASQTGPSGQINPMGLTNVQQGGDITYQILETCANARLEAVTIDGNVINLNHLSVMLYDGAEVKINGRILTFKNVQGSHSINAKFYDAPVGGDVRCYSVQDGDCLCYDGSYEYAYYNDCGQLTAYTRVLFANQIPLDLQHLVPPISCASMNQPGCVCQIISEN